MDGQKDNSISDQILAIIGENPGLKARQIADRMNDQPVQVPFVHADAIALVPDVTKGPEIL